MILIQESDIALQGLDKATACSIPWPLRHNLPVAAIGILLRKRIFNTLE
jgi:hypothetical protein